MTELLGSKQVNEVRRLKAWLRIYVTISIVMTALAIWSASRFETARQSAITWQTIATNTTTARAAQ